MNKARLLLRNMIKGSYICALKCHHHLHPLVEFENAIAIKELMNIIAWISLQG
jgi:hypothetical protein